MAGRLDLALIVRAVDQASRPLRRIGRAAGAFGRAARNVGLAGIAAGTAFGGLVRKVAISGDEIAKTADRLGLSAEALQRWRYAADLSGVSAQTFDMAVQRFGRRAAEAAAGTGEAKDALEWLGIQLTDTTGKMRPTEDLLYDVSEALSKIEDPLLRNRVAFKLFDSEGVDVGRMLAQGEQTMRAFGQEAVRLGLITEDQARQSESLLDAITRLGRAISGVGYVLTADFMPVLQPAIDRLTEFIVAHRANIVDALTNAVSRLVDTFQQLGSWLGEVTSAASEWVAVVRDAVPALDSVIEAVRSWVNRLGALTLIVGVLTVWLSRALLSALLGLIAPLVSLAWAIALATAAMLRMALVGTAKLAVALARSLAPAFGLATKAAAALAAALWANPIALIVGLIAAAIAVAAYLIWKHWDKLVNFLASAFEALKQWLVDIGLLDFVEAGRALIAGFLTGLKSAWEGVKTWFSEAIDSLLALLPDWVRKGMEGGFAADAPAGSGGRRARGGGNAEPLVFGGDVAPPVPPVQVGGEVVVRLENAPPGSRIERVDRQGDVDVTADLGYAMVP